MAAITFDTHKFVKTLEAAGIPEQQAEAISAAVQDAQESAELATKTDLREIKTEIREIRGEMRELELRLTLKLGSIVVIAIGAVAALSRWVS